MIPSCSNIPWCSGDFPPCGGEANKITARCANGSYSPGNPQVKISKLKQTPMASQQEKAIKMLFCLGMFREHDEENRCKIQWGIFRESQEAYLRLKLIES